MLEGWRPFLRGILDLPLTPVIKPTANWKSQLPVLLGSLSGDLYPGGLCLDGGSLSRGPLSMGVSVMETPSTVEEQAVLILLECILVKLYCYFSPLPPCNHLKYLIL